MSHCRHRLQSAQCFLYRVRWHEECGRQSPAAPIVTRRAAVARCSRNVDYAAKRAFFDVKVCRTVARMPLDDESSRLSRVAVEDARYVAAGQAVFPLPARRRRVEPAMTFSRSRHTRHDACKKRRIRTTCAEIIP